MKTKKAKEVKEDIIPDLMEAKYSIKILNLFGCDFTAPTKEELKAVEIGSVVKVCDASEIFWVEVIHVDDDGYISGIIYNVTQSEDLKMGTWIIFHLDDIFEIQKETTIRPAILEDAVALAVLHPSTFEIPSNKELLALKIEDNVKVCCEGERFWCQIIEIKDGIITGFIDNELVNSDKHNLFYGDFIKIKPENIYSIHC